MKSSIENKISPERKKALIYLMRRAHVLGVADQIDYMATSFVCQTGNAGAFYAFLATSIAWNAMSYAAIGAAYGSVPVSYPVFYAYEHIYNEMSSKNSTTPEDATCESHENQETNSFEFRA